MRRSKDFGFGAIIVASALGCLATACGSQHGKQTEASPFATRGAAPAAGETPSDMSDGEASETSEASPGDPVSSEGLVLPGGALPAPSLHRLTRSELAHSLQDLLGADVPIGPLEPDVVVNGFSSIGAASVEVSPAGVDLHEQAVLAATGYVFSEEARVRDQFGCVPADLTDSECSTRILTQLGRRAFRRPLTDAEVQRFTGLATSIGGAAGSSVLSGVRYALAAILESPSFVYRVELGTPSPEDDGRLKYTDFEVASRLAAMLWDSVPDDLLLDAAGSGSLATAEGVRAQAERLLGDLKAERSLVVFTRELFGTSHLDEAQKDSTLFPTWRDSLKDAMREELERRVLDVVFARKGDFLSLFDDHKTFVNDDLAEFYGLPVSGEPGFHEAEFPPDSRRAGLLGAGAILAGHGLPQRNSPTARGKFVSESLLCRIIPPPPNNVPPLPPQAGPEVTMRQRLALHRSAPVCASCHTMMDPIGFGMEDFDSAGLYRTMEGTSPVDASGVLEGPGLDGSTFSGLAELGAALRRQPVLGPCLVSKLYSEVLGRRALQADRGAIDELASGFADSQHRLDQLLLRLVTSDSFRFAEPRS